MSEPRQLRSRKPVVLIPPMGRGNASTKKGAGKPAQSTDNESVADADTESNVIGKTAPTQAAGSRTRVKKPADAVANDTVNDAPTPAPSRPSQAKKNKSKTVKKTLPSDSEPEKSAPMADKIRTMDNEDGNEALANTELSHVPNSVVNLGATQPIDPSRGRLTRVRMLAEAVVSTTFDNAPTPAPSQPNRARIIKAKPNKINLPSESEPEKSAPMADNIRIMDYGHEALANTEPSQTLGRPIEVVPISAFSQGANQSVDTSQLKLSVDDGLNPIIDSDPTDAVPGGSQATSGTETHPALVKLSQTKSFRMYGLKQVVENIADPDATPTQELISHTNRVMDNLTVAAGDLFFNRDPKNRPSYLENSIPARHADSTGGRGMSGSIGFGLPLSIQARLISASARVSPPVEGTFSIKSTLIPTNDSSGVFPSSPTPGSTQAEPRSRGLYTLHNRPDIPSLHLIDATLAYREPKTPDPASSDDDFDSTMPSDDGLPLPPPSSLPHPVTVYFCRIGRVMKEMGFIGHRSRIWKATDARPAHQYTPFTCWYNRVSERWESLPEGYTTDAPPASNRLGEVEVWWEEAEILARRRANHLAAKYAQSSAQPESGCEAESGDDAELGDEAGSGDRAETGDDGHETEAGHEAEGGQDAELSHGRGQPAHIIDGNQHPQAQCIPDNKPDSEADLQIDHQRPGYRTESRLSPSDYSESMKAKARRRQHAQKNRGLGHNEMNTEEEEADDERIMKEADEQDHRHRIQSKKASKKVTPLGDGPREEANHQVRRRLVKGQRPAPRPSAGDDKLGKEGMEFTRVLRRLVESKPPSHRPSGDSDGSGEGGATPSPHARPVASAKALGKKRADPACKEKSGRYSAHELDQVKELSDAIVVYCKDMGRTPESVLRQGGFNVSLARQPSWWDVWQMYLRIQTYNPQSSPGLSWSAQAAVMYKQLNRALSGDELEEFQQNMLVELAESKSEMEGQEFKMTKTALKQVQDLATALGRADVDMIGVIIPRDPVANQAATVVTGNPLLQCVIEHCQADVKKTLHHLTTLLRGMDSNFIVPESVDLSQLLGVDILNLDTDTKGSSAVPDPRIVDPTAHKKASKSLAKKSKSSKGVATSDPDLNLPITAVPASYWLCRPAETPRDRSRRCVPYLLRFGVAECAGPEIASASALWANFFTHCRDAKMVLKRWPCNEPIPGAKGWSITDITSNGINLIFTYMISKDETNKLAPQIVLWSDDYAELVAGSEDWLDILIVTGESESGELVVLARVRNCAPEVENAARQKDGGADCPPLLHARARSQIMEENTLKVIKKKMTATTSTQVGRQKRKLREDPKPSGADVEVEKVPSSDEDPHDNSRAPVISPSHSPPAKRVRRQELVGQGVVLGSQPAHEIQGGPRDGGWESQEGRHLQSMLQGPDNERGLDQGHDSRGMSQQRNTHNEAGSDRGGGSRPRAVIPWNDAEGRNHNNLDTDMNMFDAEGYDNAFMDEYEATRFEPSYSMQDHYHRPPPQFSNIQHYGHHPRQYAPSDFGGRGRGLRPQYRGHARPYDSNGYYGRGNEGFTGYGPRRVGHGHSENGDEERFTDGGLLR